VKQTPCPSGCAPSVLLGTEGKKNRVFYAVATGEGKGGKKRLAVRSAEGRRNLPVRILTLITEKRGGREKSRYVP